MKDSVLLANKDYDSRVFSAILFNENSNLEYWWNYAIGIKFCADGRKESGDSGYWSRAKFFPDKDAYLKRLKELLKTQGGEAFQKITVTKKEESIHCRIALSNFTFTLFIMEWWSRDYSARLYFNNSYNSIELDISMSVEEFVTWILQKNEEMIDFRREWEEHCLDVKKRVLSAKLEYQALETAMNERLKDTGATVKLEFWSGKVKIICSNPQLEFMMPSYYKEYDKIIDFVDDIVRSEPKTEN